MVLVDTSVWIRFLRADEPYAAGLDRLLARAEVLGHDMVYGELLIGDRGGWQKLLAAYALMRQLRTVAHDEVVLFVRERRLYGRGIGWVDAHLLAATILGRCRVWTADASLGDVATELGIAHTPSVS